MAEVTSTKGRVSQGTSWPRAIDQAVPGQGAPAPTEEASQECPKKASHAGRGSGTRLPSRPVEHGSLDAATLLAVRMSLKADAPAPTSGATGSQAQKPAAPPPAAAQQQSAVDVTSNEQASAAEPAPKIVTEGKHPGTYLKPDSDLAKAMAHDCAVGVVEEIYRQKGERRVPGSARRDPWKVIAEEMTPEQADRALYQEFLKRSRYKQDVNDSWQRIGTQRAHDSYQEFKRFRGDCEDLSFAFGSMMQHAHARLHQAHGMDAVQAKQLAREEVQLVGTRDHLLVGVAAPGNQRTLFETTAPFPPQTVPFDKVSRRQLGITFEANQSGTKLYDHSFNLKRYRPGMSSRGDASDGFESCMGELEGWGAKNDPITTDQAIGFAEGMLNRSLSELGNPDDPERQATRELGKGVAIGMSTATAVAPGMAAAKVAFGAASIANTMTDDQASLGDLVACMAGMVSNGVKGKPGQIVGGLLSDLANTLREGAAEGRGGVGDDGLGGGFVDNDAQVAAEDYASFTFGPEQQEADNPGSYYGDSAYSSTRDGGGGGAGEGAASGDGYGGDYGAKDANGEGWGGR